VNEGWEVFFNQGGGNFMDASAATGALMLSHSHSGWGCGLADFDNDGWLDWFTAGRGLDHGQEEGNRLFRNTGGRFADISEAARLSAGPSRLHRGVVFATSTATAASTAMRPKPKLKFAGRRAFDKHLEKSRQIRSWSQPVPQRVAAERGVGSVTAVSQLLYPEATVAKWHFP
jgi:hypothetical protein